MAKCEEDGQNYKLLLNANRWERSLDKIYTPWNLYGKITEDCYNTDTGKVEKLMKQDQLAK